MNVTNQQCNVCKVINLTKAAGWVRIITSAVTIANQTSMPSPYGPRFTPVDFCPACAQKTVVASVPAIATT